MIVINDPEYAEAIADKAGYILNTRCDQCIAREVDGVLTGGVIFSYYSPGGSVNLHMAGFARRWASQTMIWMIFDYAFAQLKVKKVFAQVPTKNTTALAINRKLGFKDEALIPDVFADDDLALLSMRIDDCPWVRKRPVNLEQVVDHGWQSQSTSPSRLLGGSGSI